MKRFKKLKSDSIAILFLLAIIIGFGFMSENNFIIWLGYFLFSINIIFFIAWRVLEEVEENKENPEIESKLFGKK